MLFIEVAALENGAHRNQNGGMTTPPDGWAIVPDGMETPCFPFGEVETEEINGVMIVTKWTAGTIPEIPETDEPVSEIERLRADVDYIAVMTGVEL